MMYRKEVDMPGETMVRKRKERHDDADGLRGKGKSAKHYSTGDMHNMEREKGKNHDEDSDDRHHGIERRESHRKEKHWKKERNSQSRERREEHMKGSDEDSYDEHRGIERKERHKKDKDWRKERDCQSRSKRKERDKGSDYRQQSRERRKVHDEQQGRHRRERHQKDQRQEEKYPKGHSYYNMPNVRRALTKDLSSKSSGGDSELLVKQNVCLPIDLSERQQLEAPKLGVTVREENKPQKSPSPTLSDVEYSARYDSRLSRGLRVSSDYAIVNENRGQQKPNQQRGNFQKNRSVVSPKFWCREKCKQELLYLK